MSASTLERHHDVVLWLESWDEPRQAVAWKYVLSRSSTARSGFLNDVLMACEVRGWDDVIELDGQEQIIFGQVLNKEQVGHICNRDFLISDLLKVAVVAKDGERTVQLWMRSRERENPEKFNRLESCPIQKGDHLSLQFSEHGEKPRAVDLTILRDYVPAVL